MAGAAIGSAADKAESVKPGTELIIKLDSSQRLLSRSGRTEIPPGRPGPVDERPERDESGEGPAVDGYVPETIEDQSEVPRNALDLQVDQRLRNCSRP